MGDPGDEKLMAYADGVLPDAERTDIEARLAADAGLRARLAVFEGTQPTALQRAFAGIAAAPVPDRLLAAIMAAPAAGAAMGTPVRRSAEVVPFRRRSVSGSQPSRFWPAAIAAGLVAAIAAVASLERLTVDSSAAVVPGLNVAQLSQHLERLASGAKSDFAGGSGDAAPWQLRPANTFAANDGRWCRELALKSPSGQGYAAVACRGTSGQWRIEAAAETVSAVSGSSSGTVRPAANSGAPPEAVETVLKRLGNGEPLGGADEKTLIEGGWKR